MSQASLYLRVQNWLARDPDPSTRAALQDLLERDQKDALHDLFAGRLRFGTAGLRAEVGPGPLRLNRLVVFETVLGVGAYLLQHQAMRCQKTGVVLGFDARLNSKDFAQTAQQALATLGIAAHIWWQPVPTPAVAYAVRHLDAAAGLMITASHNPPKDNGIKVFAAGGAQIIPPADSQILALIEAASQNPLPKSNAHPPPTTSLGPADFTAYIQASLAPALKVLKAAQHRGCVPQDSPKNSPNLRVAYTALHGVGLQAAQAARDALGFIEFYPVETQKEPDGRFPTVAYPNPEDPKTLELLLKLGQNQAVDLALAHDPDADRLAVAIPSQSGVMRILSGDEIGLLFADALLQAHVEDLGPTKPSALRVANTVVSSDLLEKIARGYDTRCFRSLTGLKWLAAGMQKHAAQGACFVFAYEEALGYAFGDAIYDKDGTAALALACVLAFIAKSKGASLQAQLDEIYLRHGIQLSAQAVIPCSNSQKAIEDLANFAPQFAPQSIGGKTIQTRIDLRKPSLDLQPWTHTEPSPLPQATLLRWILSDGSSISMRPSGTEPKLKCYYQSPCVPTTRKTLHDDRSRIQTELQSLIQKHQTLLQP